MRRVYSEACAETPHDSKESLRQAIYACDQCWDPLLYYEVLIDKVQNNDLGVKKLTRIILQHPKHDWKSRLVCPEWCLLQVVVLFVSGNEKLDTTKMVPLSTEVFDFCAKGC